MNISKASISVILWVIAICISGYGCARNSASGNAMKVRDMLHKELDSDSTRETTRFLDEIDTINLSDEDDCRKMYEKIQRYTFENSRGRHSVQTLRILQSMLGILEKSDTRNEADTRGLLNLYVRLGATYEEAGMPAVGLDYYMRGLDYCTDSIYDKYKAMLYNNIGILYAKGDMLDDAEQYFNNAVSINLKNKIHNQAFLNYINLTELYLLKKDYQKATESSNRGMDHLDSHNYPDQLGDMRIHQGNIYLSQGVFDMAMSRFQSALEEFQKCKKESGISDAYLCIADVYRQRNMPDSALVYANKALKNSRRYNLSDAESHSLSLLSKLYESNGSERKALDYLRQSLELSDSLRVAEHRLRLQQWDVFGKGVVLENPSDNRGASMSAITNLIILIIAIAAIAYLIIGLRKIRKKYNSVTAQFKGISKELEKYHIEEATMLMERMAEQDRITEVCGDMRNILLEINPKETGKKSRLREAIARLDKIISPSGTKEFRAVFERVNTGFYRMLDNDFPSLTERDRRLCVFLYLGMTTKEIADLTNREVRSVESARNRLRKKLGLEQNDDLAGFLRSRMSE